MALTLYKQNTQVVELSHLRNGLDETQFRNSATITATLYDSKGVTPIDGFVGVTLNYVGASDGIYRGRVNKDFDPPVGSYLLKITASQDGDDLYEEVTVAVKVRKG